MDKYMDSPVGPWARPMGPKMAAGPWPMGPGSWVLALALEGQWYVLYIWSASCNCVLFSANL